MVISSRVQMKPGRRQARERGPGTTTDHGWSPRSPYWAQAPGRGRGGSATQTNGRHNTITCGGFTGGREPRCGKIIEAPPPAPRQEASQPVPPRILPGHTPPPPLCHPAGARADGEDLLHEAHGHGVLRRGRRRDPVLNPCGAVGWGGGAWAAEGPALMFESPPLRSHGFDAVTL